MADFFADSKGLAYSLLNLRMFKDFKNNTVFLNNIKLLFFSRKLFILRKAHVSNKFLFTNKLYYHKKNTLNYSIKKKQYSNFKKVKSLVNNLKLSFRYARRAFRRARYINARTFIFNT